MINHLDGDSFLIVLNQILVSDDMIYHTVIII